MRTSFASLVLAASSALVAAIPAPATAPVPELGWHNHTDPTLSKRASTQIIRQCTNSGQVALTFDDGPYKFQQNIINEFAGSKGTFFLNGNNFGCIYDYADQIKAAHAAGWTIASHGYSHARMTKLSWDQIHNELWLVEQAMIKILGVKPIYFRPPYGEYNDLLMSALANRGYKKAFIWSDDTGDAAGFGVPYSKDTFAQVAKSYPQPHLVLSHETVDTTPSQVLPYAIPLLKNAGYKLVSVDTCLGANGEWPYQYVGAPQQRDSTWVCAPPLRIN